MTLKAVLFGSIGTLVETSEHQRQAFNRAFENARLDWHWNQETYEQLLSINGGRRRLRHYADEINTPMDDAQITAIHADKSRIYQQMLRTDGLSLRPGVRDLMNSARREGILVGLVSATSLANISAIDAALGDNSPLSDFAITTHSGMVERRKPAPDVYIAALYELDLAPHEVLAIEDTPSSMSAALQAGIATVAIPGHYHRDKSFTGAVAVVTDGQIADIDWLRSFLTPISATLA